MPKEFYRKTLGAILICAGVAVIICHFIFFAPAVFVKLRDVAYYADDLSAHIRGYGGVLCLSGPFIIATLLIGWGLFFTRLNEIIISKFGK